MGNYFDVENNEIVTEEEYYQHEFIDTSDRTVYFKKSLNDYKYFPENNICDFKYKNIAVKQFDELRKKYPYDKISKLNNNFERALAAMDWMGEHSYYHGYSQLKSRNSIEIINNYFDKGFPGAINCYQQSIVLSDILCSLGIYTIPVWITVNVVDKENVKFYGNGNVHVVVHAYIDEYKKWVMLDPSYNAYLSNRQKRIMNLIDFKEAYSNNGDIILSHYKLNGDCDRFKDSYIENTGIMTFRMELKQDDAYYHLVPEGLDFADYVIHIWKNDSESRRNEIKNIVDNYKYISIEEFLSVPELIQ